MLIFFHVRATTRAANDRMLFCQTKRRPRGLLLRSGTHVTKTDPIQLKYVPHTTGVTVWTVLADP